MGNSDIESWITECDDDNTNGLSSRADLLFRKDQVKWAEVIGISVLLCQLKWSLAYLCTTCILRSRLKICHVSIIASSILVNSLDSLVFLHPILLEYLIEIERK